MNQTQLKPWTKSRNNDYDKKHNDHKYLEMASNELLISSITIQ